GRARRRWWAVLATGVVLLVWAWLDAHTRTFTLPAELSAGIAIAAAYAAAYARRRHRLRAAERGPGGSRSTGPSRPEPGGTEPGGLDGDGGDSTSSRSGSLLTRRTLVVWGTIIAIAVAWELFTLFHLPRHLYPTFSSLYVAASRLLAVRVVAFAAWLALGIWIVRQ
ncbi:MAG: hypothetical protein ACYCX8_05440, partial [Acidimicrobiales bacterium]